MIIQTGVDIINLSRIEKSLENSKFLERILGESELELMENKNTVSFVAGNFAAKEAFSKSLGTGVRNFSLNEVEVLRDNLGKPYFKFSGSALDIVNRSGLSFDVSISNEIEYAVAFVVAWKND